ncbi:1126_t:CDS:2 [Ambispora gerdemannii]|uniref:1126_t:CDS:1 n=1 Tax=Ambispora gerdemannii TaxID=144530 RepID=A0A9N9AI27_9GLOM|nr:1126_t:CDS:2 [Ambispora gerdemannii]
MCNTLCRANNHTHGLLKYRNKHLIFLNRAIRTYHSTFPVFSLTPTEKRLKKEEAKPASDQVTLESSPKIIKKKKIKGGAKLHKWLTQEGGNDFRLPRMDGTHYYGETPFPMNPLFKPEPPLHNSFKDKIYELFTEQGLSPRQIGHTYSISIKRVEAILRLKHLEKKMQAKGKPLQTDFCKNMEAMLGVKPDKRINEPLHVILPRVNRPLFELVDEDEEFTPKAAAKKLGRLPFEEIQQRVLEEESKKFVLDEEKKKEEVILISKEKSEGNKRFRFVFTDISDKEKKVYIRERDGRLVQRIGFKIESPSPSSSSSDTQTPSADQTLNNQQQSQPILSPL